MERGLRRMLTNLVRRDNNIQAANPLIVDPKLFIDPEVVFRQYFCPSCAVQIETEVLLASSEPVWDKELYFNYAPAREAPNGQS